MRDKLLLLAAVLLLSPLLIAHAQEAGTDKEKEAVRRVVETYLYAEDPEERKRVISPQTRIISIDHTGSRVIESPISKPARKSPKRTITRSRQKIVSMDVTEGGASVKVETDLTSGAEPFPKHSQYLSLLKLNGQWKIVAILMPPLRRAGGAADN